ncbi:MAG: class I SAM-dependent methyltransferase [Rhodospirillaceae bacterium]
MADDAENLLRGVNALIAGGYDAVPYDEPASPGLDPMHIFSLAGRYIGPRDATKVDVLDLGCGTGAQLERTAGLTSGTVVGTDLSSTAVARTAERIARFGPRCRVMQADFMDLKADELGQFDLIYLVGVLYITPPQVQRRLLELTADCLKPDGVAVISYYSGTVPLLMAGLHKILKANADPHSSPADQIRTARAQIQTIAATIGKMGGDQRLMSAILRQVYETKDNIFFHEMLNQSFGTLTTSALEAALGTHGVHFLNWMQAAPFEANATPRTRAMMADAYALGGGGYFYGVFGKTG